MCNPTAQKHSCTLYDVQLRQTKLTFKRDISTIKGYSSSLMIVITIPIFPQPLYITHNTLSTPFTAINYAKYNYKQLTEMKWEGHNTQSHQPWIDQWEK